MDHRIFIAINLPESVKEKITSAQKNLRAFPARWVKKENLHITLIFLGRFKDEEVARVCQIAQEVAGKTQPFQIKLDKICYGPPKKIPPRMVWVSGEKSEELAKLRDNLEKEIFSPIAQDFSGTQPLSPHITLARIKQWEWRRIEPDEMPQVEQDISLDFEARSIEVMESHLKREGPEYVILESCPLKE